MLATDPLSSTPLRVLLLVKLVVPPGIVVSANMFDYIVMHRSYVTGRSGARVCVTMLMDTVEFWAGSRFVLPALASGAASPRCLKRRTEMILSGRCFAPGSRVVRYSAVLTALAILPVGAVLAQKDAKDSKKVVKQRDGDSPKFDVIINRSDDKKRERGKPVSISITFEDGSTQEVDISKYRAVTIDVGGQRVLMHSAGQPPAFIAGPMPPHRAHPSSAPGDVFHPHSATRPVGPHPVRVPVAPPGADTAPVRVPLPKGFAPGKGPIAVELEFEGKGTKKFDDNRGKIKRRSADDNRLDRLEAMLHDLQKEMKTLRAEAKRGD